MTRNGEAVWSLISILLGTLSLVLANFHIGDHWALLGLGCSSRLEAGSTSIASYMSRLIPKILGNEAQKIQT
jgi:hypothetical protein